MSKETDCADTEAYWERVSYRQSLIQNLKERWRDEDRVRHEEAEEYEQDRRDERKAEADELARSKKELEKTRARYARVGIILLCLGFVGVYMFSPSLALALFLIIAGVYCLVEGDLLLVGSQQGAEDTERLRRYIRNVEVKTTACHRELFGEALDEEGSAPPIYHHIDNYMEGR